MEHAYVELLYSYSKVSDTLYANIDAISLKFIEFPSISLFDQLELSMANIDQIIWMVLFLDIGSTLV